MLSLRRPLVAQEKFFTEHGQKVAYQKGQFLVTANEPSPWVFLIKDGYVQTCYTFRNGTKRLLSFFIPGMPFAQLGSFFAQDDGGLEYEAVGDVTAYRVTRDSFLQELQTNKAFCNDYLQSLLQNQMHLADRVLYQGEKDIYTRTVRWLLFMNKYYGDPAADSQDCWTIAVPLTQETAASFMYLTRESASTAFRTLTKKGLITTDKKNHYHPRRH